jgi:hypothetical protein
MVAVIHKNTVRINTFLLQLYIILAFLSLLVKTKAITKAYSISTAPASLLKILKVGS